MTTGQHPQHKNGQDGEVRMVEMPQIAPLELSLNSCRFLVTERPDNMVALTFQHMTGVIQYTAVLTREAVSELVRQLTGGITIANTIPPQ